MATSPSFYGNYSDRDQPAYNTVADYITDARTLLQDLIPPYRYDDPSLLVSLNATMQATRRLRADFFVFNLQTHGQVPAFQNNDDTYVPIEPQFRPFIVKGICAHAMARDQEDYQDARVTSFGQAFEAGLVGVMGPPMAGGSGPGRQ